jgi:hypothetical protein
MNAPAPSSSGWLCRWPRWVWSAWAIRAWAPKEVGSTESFSLPAFSLAQGPQVLRFFVFPRITRIFMVPVFRTVRVTRGSRGVTVHLSRFMFEVLAQDDLPPWRGRRLGRGGRRGAETCRRPPQGDIPVKARRAPRARGPTPLISAWDTGGLRRSSPESCACVRRKTGINSSGEGTLSRQW